MRRKRREKFKIHEKKFSTWRM